jgi:acyl-coenzyme A thioesterase PaaI-like protein
MTDLPPHRSSIPGRLGATGRIEGDELVVTMVPRPETMHLGVLRASALSYAADAVAGVTIDDDPEQWSFTSELSVRVVPRPIDGPVEARTRVLRHGRRSSTCSVRMTTTDGVPCAYSVLSFARVDRRPTDPVKPFPSGKDHFHGWGEGIEPLDRPLREAAGIEVVDASAGVIELALGPNLLSPAGALQGAMVALVIESAAEELVGHRTAGPALVTDIDIRYLAQSRVGPLRTRCEQMGPDPDAPVVVEVVDQTTGQLTIYGYARAIARPSS